MTNNDNRYPYREKSVYNGVSYDIKAKTKKELNEKVEHKKSQIREGRIVVDPKMTVKDWSETWLNVYVSKTVSAGTLKDYESRLKNHILPVIGNMCIQEVKDIHVQEILNNMDGFSKDRINKINNTLYQMFKKAKKNQLTFDNPADDLEKPKGEDGQGRPITMAERKIILQASESHHAGLWVKTMLYCGLRPGETERLMEAHINYKQKILYIDGTKSPSAKRYVPVPDELLEEFKKLNREPFELVFQNSYGYKLQKASRARLWNSFKREMNILLGCRVYRNEVLPPFMVADDLIPYCLRHSFATDLKDALVSDAIRKELLGHSNKDVTDRYSHRTESSLSTARELLESFRKKQDEVLENMEGGNNDFFHNFSTFSTSNQVNTGQ